jgi:hypothetical protein
MEKIRDKKKAPFIRRPGEESNRLYDVTTLIVKGQVQSFSFLFL